jgi:hypothetical protein
MYTKETILKRRKENTALYYLSQSLGPPLYPNAWKKWFVSFEAPLKYVCAWMALPVQPGCF